MMSQHDLISGATSNGSLTILNLPASIFDMSRMSLTTLQQVLAAFMDEPRIVAVARFAERAEQLAVENLGEADHGVERRAQLVAHIGEELRLGAACALGLVAGAQELGLLRLALGDVARDRDNAGTRRAPRALVAVAGRQRISTQT